MPTDIAGVISCPNCDVGRAARALVFEDDVAFNVSVALVPFLVLGLIAWWAERMGAPRRDSAEGDGETR